MQNAGTNGTMASIEQGSVKNGTETKPASTGNQAGIIQNGGGFELATIGQLGNNNQAYVTQDLVATVDVNQYGNDNIANVTQNVAGVAGAITHVTQTGNGNDAYVVQK